MSTGLECNISETFDNFMNLTAQEMTKCTRRALLRGAKELQTQTKQNISSSLKKRNNPHWYDGKIIVYTDTIEDAVMIGKVDGDFTSEMSVKVNIMGSRKKDSGTFRARFLEKDTQDREATHYRNRQHELMTYKKPKNLGKIQGKWFFKNAQATVFPNLPNIYMREIDNTINKLNNTK